MMKLLALHTIDITDTNNRFFHLLYSEVQKYGENTRYNNFITMWCIKKGNLLQKSEIKNVDLNKLYVFAIELEL